MRIACGLREGDCSSDAMHGAARSRRTGVDALTADMASGASDPGDNGRRIAHDRVIRNLEER